MNILKPKINPKQFTLAITKAGKTLQEFGWCLCPMCEVVSNKDFSFCPTCACPKKSRLMKIKEAADEH